MTFLEIWNYWSINTGQLNDTLSNPWGNICTLLILTIAAFLVTEFIDFSENNIFWKGEFNYFPYLIVKDTAGGIRFCFWKL